MQAHEQALREKLFKNSHVILIGSGGFQIVIVK